MSDDESEDDNKKSVEFEEIKDISDDLNALEATIEFDLNDLKIPVQH